MSTLYIEQKIFKIEDHYPVYDENQTVRYRVDQQLKVLGFHVDVSDGDGNFLFKIERGAFQFIPHFIVTFSDGTSIGLKSKFAFFRKVIEVEWDGPEIRLDGTFSDHQFTITKGGQPLAEISKVWTWADCFQIEVYDEAEEELALALMIAVDQIQDSTRQ